MRSAPARPGRLTPPQRILQAIPAPIGHPCDTYVRPLEPSNQVGKWPAKSRGQAKEHFALADVCERVSLCVLPAAGASRNNSPRNVFETISEENVSPYAL